MMPKDSAALTETIGNCKAKIPVFAADLQDAAP
jgi:hypothetical protein